MLGASFIALAAALALSMPTDGQKEWKWGVSFYDLQLHSIPADESAVAGDICSSAFVALVNFMQDEGGDQARITVSGPSTPLADPEVPRTASG